MKLFCAVMKHRGEILEKYIRNEKVNLTKLAERLPWTVKTIYRHLKQDDLSFDYLLEYSRALRYDFQKEFPELQAFKKNVLSEPIGTYKTGPNEPISEDIYRKKYEELMEKHNALLAKYAALLEERLNPE